MSHVRRTVKFCEFLFAILLAIYFSFGPSRALAADMPVFTAALHSAGSLEISGNAYVSGDTYSTGNTTVSGSPTIAGNGYAGGSIAFDTLGNPFLGMPYPNEPLRDFPIVDFDYYRTLAINEGKFFAGNVHLTKAKQQTGIIFVDGDLKISSGSHNITAVVTGDIKVSGNPALTSVADSLSRGTSDCVKTPPAID